jgi:predicted ribosome quality control (RQC) complex YloA/Tae2 family protein
MDGLTLTKICRLLNRDLAGSRLNRIGVTGDSLYVSLYTEGGSAHLRIRGDGSPSLSYVEKSDGAASDRLEPMNGAVLKSVDCRKYDRLVRFTFLKRRPSGKIIKYSMMCELIGRMSNIAVLDTESLVVFMLNRSNPDADRPLGIGEKYATPKMNKRLNLEEHENCGDFSELAGFYPLTVKHANSLMVAGFSFTETCQYIRSCLYDDDRFYITDNGKIIPFKSPDTEKSVDFAGYSDIINGNVTVTRSGAAKRRLTQFYEKQRKKYASLIGDLEKELAGAEKWNETYEQAVLLRDNMGIIAGKHGDFVLDFYTEEGIEKRPVTVPDKEDAGTYMEKLFKKAAKLERSVFRIQKRMADIAQFLEGIEEQLYFMENSAGEEELLALEDEMKRGDRPVTKEMRQKQFLCYQLPCGKAYVGRNAVTNHRLVFQFAAPDDLWFHTQKIPSAHLILRCSKTPSEEDILTAASIVAAHSKVKGELKAVVDYTRKKHVKKPKGTPPGFVIYHKFGSVTVQPCNEERLQEMINL